MRKDPLLVRVEWVIVLKLDAKDFSAIEKKTQEDSNLHEPVHEDVSPHCAVDDHCVTTFWASVFHNTFTRWLSSQC